jgi:tRNA-Thr(GGU) m(6)t(6)A37 methyltransferase TsaA
VVTAYTRPEDAPPQATENADEAGQVVVYEPYREGLYGLAEHRYVWLLTWLHSQPEEQTTHMRVVPRGLERTGETRGVFATRSPHRHNRLGMSLVRLVGIEDGVVHFRGVDLVDGTPVLDIKPWWRGTDCPRDG